MEEGGRKVSSKWRNALGVFICKVLGTGPMQRKPSPGTEATAVITAAGGRAFLSGSAWDPGGRRRGTLWEP